MASVMAKARIHRFPALVAWAVESSSSASASRLDAGSPRDAHASPAA